MRWDMEFVEVEGVLEKIWDLHDKLSDAIHSVSRAHFLNSVKSLNRSEKKKSNGDSGDGNQAGYVFIKGFRVDDDSPIQEAKSLNAIRTALENLEDQLEFLHTINTQQRAERDAAFARLEQSRIVLAMKLSEHRGSKCRVVEEAMNFIGDVKDASCSVAAENLFNTSHMNAAGDLPARKRPNALIHILISSFSLLKNAFKFEHVKGILGNAALFAVSMIALMQIQQMNKDHSHEKEENMYYNRNRRKMPRFASSSAADCLDNLDVLMARG